MPLRLLRVLACCFIVLAVNSRAEDPPKARFTGPWDVAALKQVPKATWGEAKGEIREVYYEGEPLDGKPTRVFAYYARPEKGDGPFPAMVLVHGGGGKAFAEWAKLWAARGYVAIAMDLAGHGPNGQRLPDGGPNQDDDAKFRDFATDEIRQMWSYHAVAAVLRGHSLLAAQKEVDPARIGITGISWGGYLTCIVAGIDDRLKVAVPVYGCGFLHENSVWLPRFEKMSPEQRARWINNFDPSNYLLGVTCPILFVNGTNDFAYPLDSYQQSYRLVRPELRTLCVTVNMPHGHPQGWSPQEIGIFADSVLKGGEPLAKLEGVSYVRDGTSITSWTKVHSKVPIKQAQIHVTTDEGAWQKRKWTSRDADLKGDHLSGGCGPETQVFFFTVTDARGATVSTEHSDVGIRKGD
jgi:dienelactone hydrolase